MFYLLLSNDLYIAIIGDMKNSKNISNRRDIQIKLNLVLDEINEKFRDDIASNLMITLGDEFQGLLNRGSNVFKIITEIELRMNPINLRFGIGIGEITTEINRDMPLGADGPAYYSARKAIDELKINEKKSKTYVSNILIEAIDAYDRNAGTTILLNSILSLATVIKYDWTDRQTEVVYDYILHGGNQIEAAERLGITQSSLNKNLTRANYYSYKAAMDTVTKALSEIRR